MTTREQLALELSSLSEPRARDLRPFLEAFAEDPDNEALGEMLGGLLSDRTIRLLRRGSQLDLADESVELADFLESGAGERLRDARPGLHAAWGALEEILAEAADRVDRDAVDSILLSHRGRGQKVLELLAERGQPVRRAEIREVLGEEVSDSLVSHLLRDLEEADLIVRFRPRGSKEVLVELGPVGRGVVRPKAAEPPPSDDTQKVLAYVHGAMLLYSWMDRMRDRQGGHPARRLYGSHG